MLNFSVIEQAETESGGTTTEQGERGAEEYSIIGGMMNVRTKTADGSTNDEGEVSSLDWKMIYRRISSAGACHPLPWLRSCEQQCH